MHMYRAVLPWIISAGTFLVLTLAYTLSRSPIGIRAAMKRNTAITMELTFSHSNPLNNSPDTMSRVPFVHKYVNLSVSEAGTPKPLAAGRGATIKRLPMKMMAIAISAMSQNKMECVVRYVCCSIGLLELEQSNDQSRTFMTACPKLRTHRTLFVGFAVIPTADARNTFRPCK